MSPVGICVTPWDTGNFTTGSTVYEGYMGEGAFLGKSIGITQRTLNFSPTLDLSNKKKLLEKFTRWRVVLGVFGLESMRNACYSNIKSSSTS